MEKKLMSYLTEFEFMDFIGFATYLKVEQDKIKKAFFADADLEELVISIVEKFSGESRKRRRELLKLAKDVVADNRNKRAKKNAEKEDDVA